MVRSTAACASRPACVVCHSVAVAHRRLLPPDVSWKTPLLDLAYIEVVVVERPRDPASASSTASAVPEVCCVCHRHRRKSRGSLRSFNTTRANFVQLNIKNYVARSFFQSSRCLFFNCAISALQKLFLIMFKYLFTIA